MTKRTYVYRDGSIVERERTETATIEMLPVARGDLALSGFNKELLRLVALPSTYEEFTSEQTAMMDIGGAACLI